ncbi:MAG: hypothetical protein ABR511_11255 [Acidimicrobiales bacterium]
MTAALGVGGVAGFVLTSPGVSGAQTTTTPSTTPATTAPAPGNGSGTTPGHTCPNMGSRPSDGTTPNPSAATNTAIHVGRWAYR